jgi:hypothetical protein
MTTRLPWPEVQRLYVGRTFRRRTPRQETRWVTDVTLRGDVVYQFDRNRSWTKIAPQAEWLDWVAKAKEIA